MFVRNCFANTGTLHVRIGAMLSGGGPAVSGVDVKSELVPLKADLIQLFGDELAATKAFDALRGAGITAASIDQLEISATDWIKIGRSLGDMQALRFTRLLNARKSPKSGGNSSGGSGGSGSGGGGNLLHLNASGGIEAGAVGSSARQINAVNYFEGSDARGSETGVAKGGYYFVIASHEQPDRFFFGGEPEPAAQGLNHVAVGVRRADITPDHQQTGLQIGTDRSEMELALLPEQNCKLTCTCAPHTHVRCSSD